MLVPNELDPGRLERDVPLPPARPKIDEAIKVVERRDEAPAAPPAAAAPAPAAVDQAVPLPKASPLKKKQ